MLYIDGATLAVAQAALPADATAALTCDVSDPAQVETAVAGAVECFGRIDAVVNNAGIAVFKPLLDTSYEEWSRVLAVNLNGPFLMVQRSEEHTSELQSLIRISYAVFGLKKKNKHTTHIQTPYDTRE